MPHAADVILLGNNLALMVAARELAAQGQSVVMLSDGKRPGAHFTGMRVDNHDFDIGMVLFEQVQRGEQALDVDSYNPEQRNDSARFTRLVSDYVEQLVDTVPVPTPSVYLDGQRHPDFVIANRLDYFASSERRADLAQALLALPDPGPLHASRKLAPDYQGVGYAEASLANHGEPLHALFELLASKITHRSTRDILAPWHRLAWLPLYYPQTLQAAVRGDVSGLSEYPFRAAREGFTGALVRELLPAMHQAGVQIVDDSVQALAVVDNGLVVTMGDGQQWAAPRVVMGLAQGRAGELLGVAHAPPKGASVCILFGLVEREKLRQLDSCLLVLDAERAIYRLSNQDVAADTQAPVCRVTVEFNPAYAAQLYPDQDEAGLLQCVSQELVALGVIGDAEDFRMLRRIQADGALPFPDQSLLDYTALLRQTAADWPGVELTAGLLGMGVSSFNDQIIQGLKLARSGSKS